MTDKDYKFYIVLGVYTIMSAVSDSTLIKIVAIFVLIFNLITYLGGKSNDR